jgi:transposase
MNDKIYVGIDVHANTYSFAEVVNSVVVKKITIPAEPQNLINALKNKYTTQQIYTVYEAGFSGFALHRKLEASGIINIIVNPSSIESDHKNKVKTDMIDASKLGIHLSQGRLKGIPIPSLEQEELRMITRSRRQLVDHRKKMIQQVRMKLHYFGLMPINYKKVLNLRDLEDLCKTSPEILIQLTSLTTIWKSCNSEILYLNSKIRRIDNDVIKRLKTIPGIGHLAAVIMYTELGDMSQFSSLKKLASYIGLTPSEYSSGENIRKGRITKQGKAELRKILIQCAHVARLKCPAIKEKYQDIGKRVKTMQIAIVAIARRLIRIAKTLIVTKQDYKPRFIGEIVDKIK